MSHLPIGRPIRNDSLYADLANYTFGSTTATTPTTTPVSPSTDFTPRPSVSAHLDDDDLQPDNASQHTFGHLATSGSTRSSSRASSIRFSDDDDDDDDSDYPDEEYGSPVTFSLGESSPPRGVTSDNQIYYRAIQIAGERRGSLPRDIPPSPSSRDREGSLVTLRRPSRSLDDDLRQFHASSRPNLHPSNSSDGLASKSDPGSRAHWQSLQASSAPIVTNVESPDGADDFDLSYIMQGISPNSRRNSYAPSVVARSQLPPQPSSSQRPHANSASRFNFFRKPSIANTVGTLDDSFSGHVGLFDIDYSERKEDWTFKKEKADAPPAGGSMRGFPAGTQEIWRCKHAGRFKVDSVLVTPQDKDPQKRINIYHIVDPFSKGNTCGGPGTIIHKHSRAKAFSLLRSYNRREKTHTTSTHGHGPGGGGGGGGGRTHEKSVRTSKGIMLAPRKVQEQYTSTATTSKLRSYGLLEEGGPDGDKRKDKDKERKKRKEEEERARRGAKKQQQLTQKEKERRGKTRSNEEADQTTSSGTVASVSSTSSATSSSSVPEKPPVTTRVQASAPPVTAPPILTREDSAQSGASGESLDTTAESITTATGAGSGVGHGSNNPSLDFSNESTESTEVGSSASSVYSGSTIRSSMVPPSMSASTSALLIYDKRPADREEDDEDDDEYLAPYGRPPTRTPHQEAFGTLDTERIHSHARGMVAHGGTSSPPSKSRFPFLIKRLGGARSGSGVGGEGQSPVPWLQTAPRAMQEESERQVSGVDDSFRYVGLLPSVHEARNRHTDRSRSSRASSHPHSPHGHTRPEVFEQVPEECLYMLLPMWVGETDPKSDSGIPDRARPPPEANKQYLLVSYIPFDEKGSSRGRVDHHVPGGGMDGKKRSRGTVSNTGSGGGSDDKTVLLTQFRATARLVSYNDLRGSGVRLPDTGLAVTGPLSLALATAPGALAREKYSDAFVIGICRGREKGVEIVPEGLYKLGLCLTEDGKGELSPEDSLEVDPKLSPIGLAAIEMVWAGCMALTSFA